MLSRCVLILSLALGLGGIASAQKTPEETVKSFTVAEGLQVELFAAEPMVINPTSMDVDHLGRVWISEAVNYRRKNFGRPILREEGDRIVILTDKNGDGKADESTVFYQGKELYGPLGVCVAKDAKGPGYKVFVCQSPDILLFIDADGDGKADGPPTKFLTGIGGFDHDHGVHGMNIGPDGKLYFTIGDQGVTGLQSSDGKGRKWKSGTPDCQAGTVWKCDIDGKNLELIAHNFRNNYECCVNSFGEVWLSDNDDDGNQQTRICFVMPGGNYGYFPRGAGQSHWHEEQPGIVHKTLRTGFGSPTGICFYEGTLLPEKYRGQLLHCDAGPRELRCFHKKPKGAGYELEKENLVTSTDNWFRLSDVCVAPDGSVMMADWYDPGVGGHGMGDWTRGRVYRLTPKGHKGYKIPEVKLGKDEKLIEALVSPCLATRALAIDHIRKSPPADLIPSVGHYFGKIRKQQPDQAFIGHEVALARTIWMLLETTGTTEKPNKDNFMGLFELYATFTSASKSSNQAMGIRVGDAVSKKFGVWLGIFKNEEDAKPESVLAYISKRFQSKDQLSQITIADLREALLMMPRMTPDQVAKLFPEYAKNYDGQDIFYRAALNIACGIDQSRRDIILADFDKQFPEWNDKVADLVWELRPKSMLPKLGKLLEDPKITSAQKGRIVDILAASNDASAGQSMLALLSGSAPDEVKVRALENLRLFLPTKWNSLAKSPELKSVIAGLLKNPATQITGLQLVAATNHTEALSQVSELIGGTDSTKPVRIEAIRTLGKLHDPKVIDHLGATIIFGKDLELANEAILAFGSLAGGKPEAVETKQALKTLQDLVTNDGASIELKRPAIAGLAGTRAGTGWLLNLRQENKLPDTLVADTGRLLRNSPFAGERNKALLLFPAAGKLDPKKLPAPSALAKRSGNAQNGEKVLAASLKGETQCLRCHMVRGIGGQIGPDLSMIGKKGSKENLYDSLLTPSKAIADQYVQWKVNTSDGKSITGLQMAETETTRTIRDANGKDYVINKADEEGKPQKSLVSIMPDNLVAAFTEEELADVVEYLMTLKMASFTPDSWNILGPFANDATDSALDKDLGIEGKAHDPAAKLKGKDGDVSWAIVKTNGTGYIDLTAHYAGKSVNSASYLQRTVDSPADQDGVILFGNDDGAKVWINGAKVFENRDHFAATPGRHQIPVKLKKGSNVVLIKIVNGSDPHGLYFALTSEQELKLGK
ncbi:PVC-type heme-binding CxxCH protein [Zavarzinella formosa]|uniref:PVC-type heme-binding CxxCH protein n=1 Tax=Zavarzinella formosa TaxID=360055 RepID=UPI0003032576|nr:PVC-type heme-binding CxxCH protein [Zavarzinella formosa]